MSACPIIEHNNATAVSVCGTIIKLIFDKGASCIQGSL
jgi:hypothetical protein